MSGIWSYIKGLFQEAEESSPSNPLIHKLIEREEKEVADYTRWKNTLVRRRLMDWLNDQYAVYQLAPDNIDETLDFLDTPSSKGFVIHFNQTNYSKRDVQHLFDYLKEQVLDLDYKTQISDTRTYNRNDWVETIERHYLKPKPDFMTQGKFNQRFGNIMIEVEMRNEKVHNLRFRATSYKDHLFQEAETFQDLMTSILD